MGCAEKGKEGMGVHREEERDGVLVLSQQIKKHVSNVVA